jgi:hypothetical protein
MKTAHAAASFAVFLIGVVAIWLPPWPPMIDLPQFAGQMVLLKGKLTGSTPWSDYLRIDSLTPYLLGYGLTLPLTFMLPVVAALKVVLTLALACLGLTAAAIRRELGAARQLDSFALIGFFGYAYAWGLLTFLIAAPLGLLVVWLSLRHARTPNWRGGLAIVIAGGALLFAHGLIFLFAVGLGLVLNLVRCRDLRSVGRRVWPFAVLIAVGAAAYLLARGEPGDSNGFGLNFGPLLLRILAPLGAIDGRPDPWTILALIALIAAPFVCGLRIAARPIERLLIAAAVFGAVAVGPDGAWVAAGIFRRFALFTPAAWAWLFSDDPARRGGQWLSLMPPVLAGLIMAQHVNEAAQFAAETKDFDAVMALAKPGKRALSIIIDRASAADVDLHVYLHFPLWYEAERNGLVDPNFAATPPSIVRYRASPKLSKGFVDNAGSFDWRRERGEQWTYFFVRDTSPVPPGLFAGAPCPPALVGASGAWALFEASPCKAGPQ